MSVDFVEVEMVRVRMLFRGSGEGFAIASAWYSVVLDVVELRMENCTWTGFFG